MPLIIECALLAAGGWLAARVALSTSPVAGTRPIPLRLKENPR